MRKFRAILSKTEGMAASVCILFEQPLYLPAGYLNIGKESQMINYHANTI